MVGLSYVYKDDLISACFVCVLPSPYLNSFCKVNQSKQRVCVLCVTNLHIETFFKVNLNIFLLFFTNLFFEIFL